MADEKAKNIDWTKTKAYRGIKKSLLSQLQIRGIKEAVYLDLVQDYMNLWVIKSQLNEDIKLRGVQVEYQHGANQKGIKNNGSVEQYHKTNAQMLKLLSELGLKATMQFDGDEDL